MKIDFPNDWKILKIGNLHNRDGNIVQTGPFGAQLHSADYVKEGVPFILIRNFKNNRIDTSDMPFITEEDAERLKRCRLKEGDIIFSRVGRIGDTVYVEDFMDGWTISGQLLRIRSDDERIYNKFLNYIIKSNYVQRQINANYVGSTRKSLNSTILEQLKIPIPLMNEQKKIVSYFSNIENIVSYTQKTIYNLYRLKKGLMQSLFTGGIGHTEFRETRLGIIPENWNIMELKDICNLRSENYEPKKNSNLKYIGLEHIDSGDSYISRFGFEEDVKSTQHRFYSEDILYGKLRPYLDKAVLVDFEGISSTDILVLKPIENKIKSEYLVNILHSSRFLNYIISTMSGTTLPRTNWRDLSKFSVKLPPYREQIDICEILSIIDLRIENQRKFLSEYNILRKGLMQDLLTGKKRVKLEYMNSNAN